MSTTKYLKWSFCNSGLRFAPLFIWKNTSRAHRIAADNCGLADSASAVCLYIGGGVADYDFFTPEDFMSFDELLQVLQLEGYGVSIEEAMRRETENYLAYCRNDAFFEQLKWFYDPTIGNSILAMDDRAKQDITIFRGLFLG